MSQFTNRHGKKISVNDDEVIVEPIATTASTKTPKQPRRRTKMPSIRVSKRGALMGVTLLIMTVVAVFVTADSIKRDYESQTAAMKRTITDRSKQSTSTETTPLDTIKNLRSSLNARSDCKVDGIDVVSWYGPAKDARQACQKTAEMYKKLQLAFEDMASIATYTTRMGEALKKSLATPTTGDYAVISDYASSWEESVSELKSIQAPEIMSSQHQNLLTKSSAVSEAWTNLNTAYVERNTEEFKKSETSLNDRYGELRTASDSIQTIITTTQLSINRYISELSM